VNGGIAFVFRAGRIYERRMKSPLALTALLLIAAGLARADVVIVQKVNSVGQSGEITVKVSGTRCGRMSRRR